MTTSTEDYKTIVLFFTDDDGSDPVQADRGQLATLNQVESYGDISNIDGEFVLVDGGLGLKLTGDVHDVLTAAESFADLFGLAGLRGDVYVSPSNSEAPHFLCTCRQSDEYEVADEGKPEHDA